MGKIELLPVRERRVGRVRIRAREQADANHLAIVLADALRTASLPGAREGEMLVVRQLKLPRVSRWTSPSALALRLESAMSTARISAVHFALPGAAEANAVIFPGRVEALVALARLHARRREPTEWFWRMVVPVWAEPQSRAARWLALLAAAYSLPEAALAGAQIFGEAFQAGVEDELLASISSAHAAEWIRAAGWTWPVPEGVESNVARGEAEKWQLREQEVIERWAARWRDSPETRWRDRADRLVWLIAILTVRHNPARAGNASLTVLALERASIVYAPASQKHAATALTKADSRPNESGSGAKLETTSPPFTPAIEQSDGNRDDAIARPFEAMSARALSSGAGLLFLIPVLERLGFAEFLSANPDLLEHGFPARFLAFVALRAGVPDDDPLALALAQITSDVGEFPVRDLPPAARNLLEERAPRRVPETPLTAWLLAVRRWCRRRARIGLASLIRRPGQVAVSRTQIDIFFDLAAADFRVRRWALDVDPGWVPWLGKIVRFHYLEGQS